MTGDPLEAPTGSGGSGGARERVLALIGGAGSGKSRLLLGLSASNGVGVRAPACVRIPVPTLSADELLRWCLDALGEPASGDEAALERCAAALAADGRELLLLVEDGDRLPLDTARTLGSWLRLLPGLRIAIGFYEHAPFEPVLAAIDPRGRRIRLRRGEPLEPSQSEVQAWAGFSPPPAPAPRVPVRPKATSRPPVRRRPAPPPPAPKPQRPSRLRSGVRVVAWGARLTAIAFVLGLLRGVSPAAPPPQVGAGAATAPAPPVTTGQPPPAAAPAVPTAAATREEPVGDSELVVVVPMPGDPPLNDAATAPSSAGAPGAVHPGGAAEGAAPAASDGPASGSAPHPAGARVAHPQASQQARQDAGAAAGAVRPSPATLPPVDAPGPGPAAPSGAPHASRDARADASQGLVRVVVNANPQARIRADGRDFGLTPLADLRLPPGNHHFAATLPDGRVVEREVELAGDVVLLFFP